MNIENKDKTFGFLWQMVFEPMKNKALGGIESAIDSVKGILQFILDLPKNLADAGISAPEYNSHIAQAVSLAEQVAGKVEGFEAVAKPKTEQIFALGKAAAAQVAGISLTPEPTTLADTGSPNVPSTGQATGTGRTS